MKILLLTALLGPAPHIVPPPGGSSATGVATSGATAACTGDKVLYDNNGVQGCQRITDAAPQGVLIRPQPAYPGGTQTAASVIIAGGQDETKIAIDGADPSVTCAGNNDTVTVTVVNSNGSSTATVLTGDTEWAVSASVATTCSNLAAAVDALSGVGATCTSPNVLVTLDPSTASVTLAESTAGCTTVSTGTFGGVVVSAGLGSVANTPVLYLGGKSVTDVMIRAQTSALIDLRTGTDSAYATLNAGAIGVETSGGFLTLDQSNASMRWWGGAAYDTGVARGAAGIVRVTSGTSSADGSGLSPGVLTFASLGSPSNGTIVYCSDCTKATPCAGSGSGAFAKRINSAWDCD